MNPFDVEADRCDLWFESGEGKAVLEIEKSCPRGLLPIDKCLWLEVGVGTDRSAGSFGIRQGVDTSLKMPTIAARRGIHVVRFCFYFGAIGFEGFLYRSPSNGLYTTVLVMRKGIACERAERRIGMSVAKINYMWWKEVTFLRLLDASLSTTTCVEVPRDERAN